jgi:hypothetical protein
MKKIISFLLLIVLMNMTSMNVFAENKEIDFTKYNDFKIMEIKNFPKDVVPIEINSEEELEDLISEFAENNIDIQLNNRIQPTSSGNYTVRISGKKRVGTGNINLYADVDCYHYNNYREIKGASNIYTTLTGYTLGTTWEEKNIDYSINDGTRIKLWADGTIHIYILLDGIGRVISKDTSVTASYSLY